MRKIGWSEMQERAESHVVAALMENVLQGGSVAIATGLGIVLVCSLSLGTQSFLGWAASFCL